MTPPPPPSDGDAAASSGTPPRGRVIAHFDLDAFYVGCERELNPSALIGAPVAVSQYNPYGALRETSASETDRRLIARPGRPVDGDANGSLIAVSYEARAAGVRRNDRGRDAVSKCPDLRIVQVPVRHGKADLSMYRDASHRVLKRLVRSMREHAPSKDAADEIRVEKASIDEIYVDLTAPASEMAKRAMEEREDGPGKGRSRPWDGSERSTDDRSGEGSGGYWRDVLQSSGAASCTTIGGVEDVRGSALAANSLSKDELRRGSRAQVEDSSSALDDGSRSWWDRSPSRWSDAEVALACGAALASRARADVASHFAKEAQDGTGRETFTLSAGVSANKTLAKLASGMKKPNRQTIIDPEGGALQKLFHPLPIGRIRGLGGKFGAEVGEKLGVETVGDLAKVPLADIERHYPPRPGEADTARFLFDISRGACDEEVADRTLAKSVGCGKTFRNHLALDPRDEREVRKWAEELCGELTERLDVDKRENLRAPRLFGVSVRLNDRERSASKSTCAPRAFEKYAEAAMRLIGQIVGSSKAKIEGLTMFASSFVEIADDQSNIMAAFGRVAASKPSDEGSQQSATSNKIRRKRERKGSLQAMWSQSENVDDSNRSKNGDAGVAGGTAKPKRGPDHDDDSLPDDVDPAVFSQLPPSIQEEIRRSRTASTKPRKEEPKKQGWKKKGINGWLSQTAGESKERVAAISPRRGSQEAKLPGFDDIDEDTLAELPPDIREAILKDIAAAANPRSPFPRPQKRKRIDNFFSKR